MKTTAQLRRMVIVGHIAERCMEYIPPLITTVMVLHDLLLCLGYRWAWTETVVILAAVVLMLLFSYALGFCALHRAFILYNWMMLFCIHFERTIGFNKWLQPMHYIMLFIGACLLVKISHRKCMKTKKKE